LKIDGEIACGMGQQSLLKDSHAPGGGAGGTTTQYIR